MRNEPEEVPDTAAIIDVGERLLAESRALLDDMSQQLESDVVDLNAAPAETGEQQQKTTPPPS